MLCNEGVQVVFRGSERLDLAKVTKPFGGWGKKMTTKWDGG